MNTFSKLGGTSGISGNSSGIWRLEKKRKARDKKNRLGNDKKKKQEAKEEDVLIPVDEKLNNEENMECEDQIGYGFKKIKSRCAKIDLKI